MNKAIIFANENTATYNPIMEIPDINTEEAFNCAKKMALIVGWKKAFYVGLILYVRFSKNISEKEKTFETIKKILNDKSLCFQNVYDVGCVKDNGQEWYEMNALIITFLSATS